MPSLRLTSESHELSAGRSHSTWWSRSQLAAAVRERPALATRLALVVLAGLSILVRSVVAAHVHGPFFFMDELGYQQMARSFAETGHFSLFGKQGLAYSPLYPIVLSPIYALTTSAQVAYEWVKVVNSVLLSLSVFPVYAIARFVLSRRQSLGVAALALVAPLMSYTSLGLSENLAYPLFLLAVWRLLGALREPRPRNDALLLGTILLACAARLQAVVLVPAVLTAILLIAARAGAASKHWTDPFRQMLVRHRLLLGTLSAGLVAVVGRTVQDGGSMPLAGRYAVVGHARPPVAQVASIALQHLATLDLAVGVVPFACALAAGYALIRSRLRGRAFVWGTVAVATTSWLLLEVGFDAAAFDKSSRLPTGQIRGDLPRIHERYLIYLIPFFLVALVALVRGTHARLSRRTHVLVALIAAALPAVIPFTRDINYTSVAESPSLQLLGTVKHGLVVPGAHPTATALAISALLAAVYLLAFFDRRPPLAVAITALAFASLSFVAMARIASAASGSTGANLPAQRNWVDRVARRDVALVSGIGARRVAALETAYNNLSISRLYYVCQPSFESDFGERALSIDTDGRLQDGGTALRARYVVAPTSFAVRGRVLARDRRGGLELVAPAHGVVAIPPQRRDAISCGS